MNNIKLKILLLFSYLLDGHCNYLATVGFATVSAVGEQPVNYP